MRAVVSLGTNTTRFLVIEEVPAGGVRVVDQGSAGTRLGAGLRERGSLDPVAMERTLAAVAGFVARIRERGAEVSCIATSAMRRASNADAFAGGVEALTGVAPTVLDGAEEAAASFAGATFGARSTGGRVAVLDIGGGSTECAVGRAGEVEAAVSVEIGAVRLAEMFPETMGASPPDAARAAGALARSAAREALTVLASFAGCSEVRAVGGSAMVIGALANAVDVKSVAGTLLQRDDVDALVHRLLGMGLSARRALPGMLQQRADIVPAGGMILSEALAGLGARAALLPGNDLLLGYLLQAGGG